MKPASFEKLPNRRARDQVRSAGRKLRNRKQRRRTSFFSFEPLEERCLLATLYDFSAGTFAANEGDATNTTNVVMLSRDDGSAAEDVDVVLAAGTTNPAAAGTDFTAGPITVRFSVGETSKPVPIEILGEMRVELDETIDLSLSSFSGGGQIGTTNPTATLTLTNNDLATLSVGDASVIEGDSGTTTLSFPITLDNPVDVNVSFEYETEDSTATAANSDFVTVSPAATFTINAGDTSGTIDVTVNGDNNLESDETLTLALTNLEASFRDVTLTGTVAVPLGGWEQIGQDIDGEVASENSGRSVAMSADGKSVIVGAPNGVSRGLARIYDWSGTAWAQRGSDIVGEAVGDEFGYSVAMSADGKTVIIGARLNDGGGTNSGHARIFEWDGTAWVQKGGDIDGAAAGDLAFQVAMSADGNTIILGAESNDGGGSNSGHARIYAWSGTAWVQRGNDINGEAAGDGIYGISVAMSADGNTVVIGAPYNDGGGINSGHARIYDWNGTAWAQRGSDIDAEAAGHLYGYSVEMSADGNTVIIGALGNYARIVEWDGTSWVQKGGDIDGEASGDQFGVGRRQCRDHRSSVERRRGK